ncbi:MAG: response regulator, partial [Nitrososphaeraceae archaeon]
SPQNEIIIGNNLYRILKSFSNIANNYNFINNGDFKVTENIGYPTFNIKRRKNTLLQNDNETNSTPHSMMMEEQLNSSAEEDMENKHKKRGLFFHKNNNNKGIIIVDDDQEIVFTYRLFLEGYDYHINSFTDPFVALNYIKDLPNFDNLLVTLDIRMQNLNGFQLHQQIKAIDLTIKILFVTALDILDEFSTIIPGISKEQIMRKPVDKKLFTNTVKKLLN